MRPVSSVTSISWNIDPHLVVAGRNGSSLTQAALVPVEFMAESVFHEVHRTIGGWRLVHFDCQTALACTSRWPSRVMSTSRFIDQLDRMMGDDTLSIMRLA